MEHTSVAKANLEHSGWTAGDAEGGLVADKFNGGEALDELFEDDSRLESGQECAEAVVGPETKAQRLVIVGRVTSKRYGSR